MNATQSSWLEQITLANQTFRARIQPEQLPVARIPGQAVITCMDPRVNLEAIGIPPFEESGAGSSAVRIIRTLGGIAENRSLIVGIYLAGFREIVVMMHTDCGGCLAYSKMDVIVENMQQRLSPAAFQAWQSQIGDPFTGKLREYLHAFQEPRAALEQEIARIHALPFIPDDLIVHGLLYELQSGKIEIIVNGYNRT